MFKITKLFFISSFIYFLFLSVTFQTIIVPSIVEIDAGHGLVKGDALVFHDVACQLADRINRDGWRFWSVFPGDHSLNVGFLAALYAVFGCFPLLLLPFNAFAQSCSAFLIYLIGRKIWPGSAGKIGGIIGSIVFILFLSPLVWYGQNHKDTFVLPAMLAILYGFIFIINSNGKTKDFSKKCLVGIGALSLIFLMRPNYYCLIVSICLLLSLLSFALITIFYKGTSALKCLGQTFLYVVLLSLISLCTLAMPTSYLRQESLPEDDEHTKQGNIEGESVGRTSFVWKETSHLPTFIDKKLKKISRLRAHFISHGIIVRAGSGIDLDKKPGSTAEVLAYLPRAMWIGLFAPFPFQWLEKMSAIRLVSSVETFIWCLFFPGVIYLAICKPSPGFWVGTVFCLGMITLFSYVNPNLGTLYRVRFGFWFFFLTCGAVGWVGALLPIIQKIGGTSKERRLARLDSQQAITGSLGEGSLSRFFSAGSLAMLFSWIGFLGFFVRDLLLIRSQGLVGSLDALMSSGMFVVVAVSCVSLPLADALSRPLQECLSKNRAEAERIVQVWLRIALMVLGSACVLLWLVAPQLGAAFFGSDGPLLKAQFIQLFRLSIPILLMSGWTVIGNAVLNNLYKAGLSAAAQITVPVVALLSILVVPTEAKLIAAVIGMVLGTFLNALLVAILCLHHKIRLWPAWNKRKEIHQSLFKTYVWLVPFAALSALAGPANYFFAAQIGKGGITLWALTGKITACFSQFISVAAAALILPHISGIIEKGKHVSGREHTYFLLVTGTWMGGLIALGLSLFADPLAALLLSDRTGQDQIQAFAHLVRIGALQIPVAMAAAILVKSATASGAVPQATWGAFIGLLANIVINILLVPRIGLAGVACGALVGTAITTLLTCLATRTSLGISRGLGAILVFGWAAWAGVVFSVESRQGWGMAAATAGLIILALLHKEGWKKGWVHRSARPMADVRP
jgi:peptidoglycan biosynthesis protein MviN/MurJ (putative lipid II flippase)